MTKSFYRGQSLFETVVAFGIIALVFIGIVSLTLNTVVNAARSRDKTKATRYAEELLEWLRYERDRDWVLFNTKASQPLAWCMPNLVWPAASGTCGINEVISGTKFKREVTFIVRTANKVVSADVVVRWSDGAVTRDVKSSTYFTNWRSQ